MGTRLASQGGAGDNLLVGVEQADVAVVEVRRACSRLVETLIAST